MKVVKVKAESAVEAKRIANSKNPNYIAVSAQLDLANKRPYRVAMQKKRTKRKK